MRQRRHSIRQRPARSAWVIHGGHFVSKSLHKSVCPERGGWHSLCLETVSSVVCQRCGKSKEIWEKRLHNTHTPTECFFLIFFHLLNSPAAVSLKFFNNSVLEDMIQEGSLCLSQAWLPLAPCSIIVIHTTPNAPSQIIRRFIKGMGRYHSLWSFAIQIFYFFSMQSVYFSFTHSHFIIYFHISSKVLPTDSPVVWKESLTE